jgi:hypothetical protein
MPVQLHLLFLIQRIRKVLSLALFPLVARRRRRPFRERDVQVAFLVYAGGAAAVGESLADLVDWKES